jgi:hypothetical protein
MYPNVGAKIKCGPFYLPIAAAAPSTTTTPAAAAVVDSQHPLPLTADTGH